jgi:hypothetical protein
MVENIMDKKKCSREKAIELMKKELAEEAKRAAVEEGL